MLADQDIQLLTQICDGAPSQEVLDKAREFQKAYHKVHQGACPAHLMITAAVIAGAIQPDAPLVPTIWTTTEVGTWLNVKEMGGGQYRATFEKEHTGNRAGQLQVKAFGTESRPVLAENCSIADQVAPKVPMTPENQEPESKLDDFNKPSEPDPVVDLTSDDPTLEDITMGDPISYIDGDNAVDAEFVSSSGDKVVVDVGGTQVEVGRDSVVVT